MNDNKRTEQIDDYCKRLAEAWKKMQCMQLFPEIVRLAIGREFKIDCLELSTMTDEALITAIEKMVEHGK